ncbi:hypothetical protein LZ31DRAFT_529805, partial [Colletotrichum somersetense]
MSQTVLIYASLSSGRGGNPFKKRRRETRGGVQRGQQLFLTAWPESPELCLFPLSGKGAAMGGKHTSYLYIVPNCMFLELHHNRYDLKDA